MQDIIYIYTYIYIKSAIKLARNMLPSMAKFHHMPHKKIKQYIYINIYTYNIIYIFSNICINIYNIIHINSIISCANIMQLQMSKRTLVTINNRLQSSKHSHATSQPSKPSTSPGKLPRRQSTTGPQYAMSHIGQNFNLYIIHKQR